MPICIYSKQPFEQADGEHVLQNFLGARWTSNQIVCNSVQKEFGETIDSALEEALRPFRNLLGSKGGRGGEGPPIKNLKGRDGRTYHLLPGGKPVLAKPFLSIQRQGPKHFTLEFEIASKKQVGWLLCEVKKQIPEIDEHRLLELKEQILNAPAKHMYLPYPLENNISIGGDDYFRALLKASFNLLGAMNSDLALAPCFDSVREYILQGTGGGQFIRWSGIKSKLEIEKLNNFDHFIGIYSNEGNIDGVFQVFGSIYHIFRLTDNYNGDKFSYSYLVNPLRNTEPSERRNIEFDISKMPKFDESFLVSDNNILFAFDEMIKVFLISHSTYAKDIERTRIIKEVFEKHKKFSGYMTPELINELANKVTKLAMRHVPGINELIKD